MKHKNSISFSTIEDLRNLIDKNGALPNYISRDHVCQDLSTFLDSETDPIKKKEVIKIFFDILESKLYKHCIIKVHVSCFTITYFHNCILNALKL